MQGFGDVLEKIRERNLAVELNTSGFHYPVKEAFPSPDLLRRCARLQIPLVTGSDAHAPRVGGQGFRPCPGPAESRRLRAIDRVLPPAAGDRSTVTSLIRLPIQEKRLMPETTLRRRTDRLAPFAFAVLCMLLAGMWLPAAAAESPRFFESLKRG